MKKIVYIGSKSIEVPFSYCADRPHLDRIEDLVNDYLMKDGRRPEFVVMGLDFYEGVAAEWTFMVNQPMPVFPEVIQLSSATLTIVVAPVPEPVVVGNALYEFMRSHRG